MLEISRNEIIYNTNMVSLHFRLGVLSPDGKCKSFDRDANGYARAEAIPVIFIQKAKDAKRVYAQILHAKTNCDGYKEQGITYPAGHIQKMLLSEFYGECKINPVDLEFVESHGTGLDTLHILTYYFQYFRKATNFI